MNDAIEDFMDLFQGRTDAQGTWEGGSKKEPVTYTTFANHLYGKELIGIYPLMDNSNVWWGCSDIDIDDIDSARNIQTALRTKGVTSWVERTVRGFHVWIFSSEPCPAPIMRRALLAAHAAVNVPPKEINPKQEVATGLGNYVRLPYPSTLSDSPIEPPVRMILNHLDENLTLGAFLKAAKDSRVHPDHLKPVAELYTPKPVATFDKFAPTLAARDAIALATPYSKTMWRDGPMQESDRSNVLCRLAYRLHEEGMEIKTAYTILQDADRRWGKFYLRPDGEEQLLKIINMAYGESN